MGLCVGDAGLLHVPVVARGPTLADQPEQREELKEAAVLVATLCEESDQVRR